MQQFQVIVEYDGKRLFETEWVTGREAAERLTMLIASKFPEPYVVMVNGRDLQLTSIAWSEFVTGTAV